MASTRAMLLLVLGLLLSAGPGTLAKKGKAETIDSNFQPGEGGIAERTGEERAHWGQANSIEVLTAAFSFRSSSTDAQHLCS